MVTSKANRETAAHPVFQHPPAKLLSQLETDEVQWASFKEQRYYGKGEPGRQVRGEVSSPPHSEIGYQAPVTTKPNRLNTRAADLRDKIIAKLESWGNSTFSTLLLANAKRLECSTAYCPHQLSELQKGVVRVKNNCLRSTTGCPFNRGTRDCQTKAHSPGKPPKEVHLRGRSQGNEQDVLHQSIQGQLSVA